MDLEQAKVQFSHAGNEAAIIACVLKDPTNYFEVDAKLVDNDFLTPHHRAIWRIIKTLNRSGVTSADAASILSQASAMKVEELIGGYDYINALFEKFIDPETIGFYINRVLDASIKLKVLQAADNINDLTYKNKSLTEETLTADDIVNHAQQEFLKISIESKKDADAVNIADGIPALLEEARSNTSDIMGLPTGFDLLDKTINGLEPGTLTVVGARPKVGKSTLLMTWARHLAYKSGMPALYIDTEMSTREQQFRLLSMLSSVPEREIKNGTYFQDEQKADAVREAEEITQSGLIMHKYYPDFTPEGVSALARKYYHQFGISCLIFDYIKLPDADLRMIGNVKEYQALGYLSVALKNLAGQLEIPVVTASQLNRESANRGYVSSANFADSDRLLRYANTLLGLACKTKKEMIEFEEAYGKDALLNAGTHRLQVLDTRAGGSNYGGIDIRFRQEMLHMKEAPLQTATLRSDQGDNNGF